MRSAAVLFFCHSGCEKIAVIEKIISGGQTGADRAALDGAIEYGIPHGGWVPKGRMTETGRLPEKYVMQETTSISYAERTEMNVVDSDATLLLSHGKVAGGSAFTLDMARKHRKPCLPMDLASLEEDKAAEVIINWVGARGIKVLNVAGPRASEDPGIYDAARSVLALTILGLFPKRMDEAVDMLLAEMPMKEKAKVANTDERALENFEPSIALPLSRRFGLWAGNLALLESCARSVGKSRVNQEEAAAIIMKELWRRLRVSHSLRAVK